MAGHRLERLPERRLTDADPAVRVLPPVGAIDQYVDNPNVTYHRSAELRRRYIADPRLDT
jgi:hypothetical protein